MAQQSYAPAIVFGIAKYGGFYGRKSLQGVATVFCFRHMQFIVLDPI